MSRKFTAVPGNGIVAGKIASHGSTRARRNIVANHSFYWDTYGPESDPADWRIDYDEFFEAIEANIDELGLHIIEYEDEPTIEGRIRIFQLSNGVSLNSYDLEVKILYALDDRDIADSQTDEFIKNYIKNL